ncbi:MAG: methyl-accepting chemotaxis protein [Halodesulfovibrio sp.]
MAGFIRNSIGAKTSLLVSFISFIIFTALVSISSYMQRTSMMSELDKAMTTTSELVQLSIEKPMVVGNDAGTRDEFRFLSEKYKDMTIYLTNFKGNITYSTDSQTERKDFDAVVQNETLSGLTARALKVNTQESAMVEYDGGTRFVRVVSIPNDRACHHCHGASQPILGQMVVMQDITPTVANIDFQLYENIAISLGGLLTLIAAVVFFIRRSVVRPLLHIANGSEEISKGNLNADLAVHSEDELGALSKNLGHMVEKLKTELGFSKGILDGMTTPALVVDTNCRISFTNPALLKLVGRTGNPADYVGQSVGEFMFNDARRETLSHQVLAARTSFVGHESTFTNRRGDAVTMVVDSSPIYDLDGKLIGAFTICTDMTEVRRQQALVQEQNEMITHAAHAAGKVSEQVSSASEELSAQIQQSSAGADEQRKLTADSAAAMTEMNASVLEVAQNASLAAESASEAQRQAMEGARVVDTAVQRINTVAEQANMLKQEMGELGRQAQGIGQIITVIEDIADQTNLLALNAAIEAARAGEAGRGFAVVADEVRKLAEKTMSATREVVDFVGSIQDCAKRNVTATDRAVTLVGESTELASQSGHMLHTIVGMVESTADQVRAIATASEQQSAASEQISRSVEEINTISSETAQAMLESANAVADLARLAQELNGIIEEMRRK